MMLLAGVVLILGFVALTGMVARVGQLPTQIPREQNDPIFLEVDPLTETIESIVSPTSPNGLTARSDAQEAATTPPTPWTGAQWEAALTQALTHLQQLEGGKGFVYRFTVCYVDANNDNQPTGESAYVWSEISDDAALLTMRSSAFSATGFV